MRPPAVPDAQPEVVALLVPFLHPTPQEAANNLLFLYIQYHRPLGFAKFVQYTQARPPARPPRARPAPPAPRSAPACSCALLRIHMLAWRCCLLAQHGGRHGCEPIRCRHTSGPCFAVLQRSPGRAMDASLPVVSPCAAGRAQGAYGGVDLRSARAQSTFLGGFLTDERLRRLVAENALEFVLWDSTTECTDHLKCFQPVMYSHAVLAFWGANVYLCAPPQLSA
jgi:hypothetical protein